jgi:hypothetical protein
MLNYAAFTKLGEPKRIRMRASSGIYGDGLITIFSLPKGEIEPIELYAGGFIRWD